MNVEMVAQMFANYRNNVKFHLEGNISVPSPYHPNTYSIYCPFNGLLNGRCSMLLGSHSMTLLQGRKTDMSNGFLHMC